MSQNGTLPNVPKQLAPFHTHTFFVLWHHATAPVRPCHHGIELRGTACQNMTYQSYRSIWFDHFFLQAMFLRNLLWTALHLQRYSWIVRLLANLLSTLLDKRASFPTTSSFISPEKTRGDGIHFTFGRLRNIIKISCLVWATMWYFDFMAYPVKL